MLLNFVLYCSRFNVISSSINYIKIPWKYILNLTSSSGILSEDQYMKHIKDLELVNDLPKFVKEIPVILMTGEPSLIPNIQSVQPPVVACLIKPFDFNELLEHVKVLIGG